MGLARRGALGSVAVAVGAAGLPAGAPPAAAFPLPESDHHPPGCGGAAWDLEELGEQSYAWRMWYEFDEDGGLPWDEGTKAAARAGIENWGNFPLATGSPAMVFAERAPEDPLGPAVRIVVTREDPADPPNPPPWWATLVNCGAGLPQVLVAEDVADGSTNVDVGQVMAHEFGHVLGLDHVGWGDAGGNGQFPLMATCLGDVGGAAATHDTVWTSEELGALERRWYHRAYRPDGYEPDLELDEDLSPVTANPGFEMGASFRWKKVGDGILMTMTDPGEAFEGERYARWEPENGLDDAITTFVTVVNAEDLYDDPVAPARLTYREVPGHPDVDVLVRIWQAPITYADPQPTDACGDDVESDEWPWVIPKNMNDITVGEADDSWSGFVNNSAASAGWSTRVVPGNHAGPPVEPILEPEDAVLVRLEIRSSGPIELDNSGIVVREMGFCCIH